MYSMHHSCSYIFYVQDVLQPIRLIQEYPIFRRSELPCSSGPGVTHIVVTNNLASMVIVGNVILRFPVSNPRNIERELCLWQMVFTTQLKASME